ncbi:MAG TPA: S41 family peptidase [Gemmatimonadales bacterium]
MHRRSRVLFPRLGVLALTLALGFPGSAGAQAASYEQLQTFSSLLNQIRLSYVDSVTYAELIHAAVDGVLGSLDPHSRFVRRADAERELAYEQGALAGIGVALDMVDDRIVVLAVAPNGPAARAGISPGDRLRAIDDTTIEGLSLSDAASRLLGDKGRKVRLSLERGPRMEPDTFRVTVKLDVIEPKSVGAVRMVDRTTGYVRLLGFHLKGGDEVEKAVRELEGKGARRLVLDLRGNPGGILDASEEIAGLFLPKQTLIYRTDSRRPAARQELRTTRDGPFRDLPLSVLIDGGSASASEAVAASLQDHDRALLLGRRSFGKALVQRAFPVPPQGDLVWLTVARVVTPSGRVIQRSYQGLKAEQYYSFAGRSGAAQDTLAVFHSDRGRVLRGGGGIVPDVPLPEPASLPRWWRVVADSGWYEAVADSVAVLLPRDPRQQTAWLDARAEWQARLVGPLAARVRDRLGIAVAPDSQLAARLGRILARRAAEVRWGPESADEFTVHNDPDIQAAMALWDRLPTLLGAGH